MKKIGLLSLALVLALGALGVGYAAWTDQVTIEGTVTTGSVELDVQRYSGTYVWKDNGETVVWTGWMCELEEWAGAEELDIEDAIGYAYAEKGPDNGADVVIVYHNIFPCIDWTANVELHYAGQTPAYVSADIDTADEWLMRLWDEGYVTYSATLDGETITDAPVQVHYCDVIEVALTIYIPQEDELQGLEGSFSAYIGAIQFNKVGDWEDYFPPNGEGEE